MFKELAYYDGKIGTPDEVMIPFNDRSHFFGDGVYEATAAGNHVPYLIDDHLDRFYSSAAALDINIPMEKAELKKLLQDLVKQVEGNTHFVYWQVTRGVAPRGHIYGEGMVGKLWVYIRPSKIGDPETAIKLKTRPDLRFEYGNIKTLNLLPAVLYSEEASRDGVHETVLHRNGVVTECAHSNISIIKDGYLISHPNDQYILRGIAKTHMIQACYRLGIPVLEREYTLEELMDADEILVTSSSNFILFADTVDGKKAGNKDPETRNRLKDELVREYFAYTGRTTLND
ncbi:MAG: aminotransferase class IV [Anaerovibrio sp.]|uniref:aminotransferase class IV n=1 Tax=Anaerovibrio sp. TaxID=1872532 RepID=UPI0025E849B5|nr:aminotransferase class IV [Anaerovibrio sp.]MCR5175490.1 aminotransferase class IV [Anaerovibrio sp.]